jgi:hypothetical protein
MDDEKAVQELLTPMFFQETNLGVLPMRPKYLFPELEATAIELAILVGRLEQVEDEKKEANADFKERIDLLKFQIKQAAKTINEGVLRVADGKVASSKGQPTGSGVPGYVPEQDGEAAH